MSSQHIFKVSPTDCDLQRFGIVPFQKLSTSMTPMKFSLCALNNYCDLNRSYLVLYLLLYSAATNVLLAEEEAVSDDDDDTRFTCVVTNLAHSIFKQINLRFNGALMSEQTDTSAYSAFFQTLPNCSSDDCDTLLQPQGWINYLDVTPTLASTSWTTNARRFFLVVYYIFY